MKLYQNYLNVLKEAGEIEYAWFTTFNLDAELLEKYLLAPLAGMSHTEMRTTEDYEALNAHLVGRDIAVWYDFRALNSSSAKRTCVPLLAVEPADYGAELFHPKVIFIKGTQSAWLICGSANLTIAGWAANRESVIIREISHKVHGTSIMGFFNRLGAETAILDSWVNSLKGGSANWDFFHAFMPGTVFDRIGQADELTIWSPYFSGNISGLIHKLQSLRYQTINLVPDMTPQGKVRITAEELLKLGPASQVHFKLTKEDDLDIFNHAKVWLTENRISVGSWNCTFKATRISQGNPFNIEAGIISDISPAEHELLKNTLVDQDVNEIAASTVAELEKEWEQVLENFTYCCRITADWKTFSYGTDPQSANDDYFLSLPDAPNERVPILMAGGRSFRRNFDKVLANKTFTVYDRQNKEIYRGYLQELHPASRPVLGYQNVSDLIDSLLRDPSGETASARVVYTLETDAGGGDGGETAFLYFQGTQSYYRMFVAFQLLFERLQKVTGQPKELDKVLFRLPGSLLQIRLLIFRMVPGTEDEKLFLWFLVQEFNRCAHGLEIEPVRWKDLSIPLKTSARDRKFMNNLFTQFAYEL